MKNVKKTKLTARLKRAKRLRYALKRQGVERGTVRCDITRSGRHIYAQVLAAVGGKVLAQASSLEFRKEPLDGDKKAVARRVGELLGERALAAGLKKMACDRSGFKYHGRVAALVDGVRESGIQV